MEAREHFHILNNVLLKPRASRTNPAIGCWLSNGFLFLLRSSSPVLSSFLKVGQGVGWRMAEKTRRISSSVLVTVNNPRILFSFYSFQLLKLTSLFLFFPKLSLKKIVIFCLYYLFLCSLNVSFPAIYSFFITSFVEETFMETLLWFSPPGGHWVCREWDVTSCLC